MKNLLSSLLLTFLFSLTSQAALYGQTVYITKTGEKYHKEDCGYLKYSKIKVSLSDVKDLYSPCSACKPPSNIQAASKFGSSETNESLATQCTGKTKEGRRCLNRTKDPSGRCHHHR